MLLAYCTASYAFTNPPVKGYIYSKKQASAVSGATVHLAGTDLITKTNEKGMFELAIPDGEHQLMVKKDGKKPTVYKVTKYQDNLIIMMEEEEKPEKELLAGWDASFSGNINANYVYTKASFTPAVSGEAVQIDGNALMLGDDKGVHTIQNGLLPTGFVFNASTMTADSVAITVTLGAYPGLASTANTGLSTPLVDIRQTFMTISKKGMGTFTVGRNYGMFGFDAIVNDISLTAVGATAAVRSPLNTTLGGIGYGYPYADVLSQINYTTPTFGGFNFTAGVYQPFDLATLGMESLTGESQSNRPGVHGKVSYSGGPVYLSSTFITQDVNTGPAEFTSIGYDVFGRLTFGSLKLSGYYQGGQGIGTTILLFDAADAQGNARSTNSWYGQASYGLGDKLTVGFIVAQSNNDPTENDPETILESNTRITGGFYYNLTGSLNLNLEFTNMRATNPRGDEIINNSINLGTFLSF